MSADPASPGLVPTVNETNGGSRLAASLHFCFQVMLPGLFEPGTSGCSTEKEAIS